MSNKVIREKKKDNNKKIIIAGIVIIIILLAILVFLLLKGLKNDAKRNVVVTPDNVEDVAKDMADEEYIEPGYYSVSMNNIWNFAKGDAVSEDAYVANREENTNDVYFDVFLTDDEENPIFKSPVIPRGGELKDIALDKPLSAGTYDCVMVYHLIDEEQNTISTLRVGFTIIVEQ